MNWKQIETSREVRLWIGQVIVPIISAGAIIYSNENARNWVSNKFNSAKNKLKKKFEN